MRLDLSNREVEIFFNALTVENLFDIFGYSNVLEGYDRESAYLDGYGLDRVLHCYRPPVNGMTEHWEVIPIAELYQLSTKGFRRNG